MKIRPLLHLIGKPHYPNIKLQIPSTGASTSKHNIQTQIKNPLKDGFLSTFYNSEKPESPLKKEKWLKPSEPQSLSNLNLNALTKILKPQKI